MNTAEYKSTRFSLYRFFLQVLILWGLMSFLIWLILTPKHPIYKVVDVHISHLDRRNSTIHHNGRNSTFQHGWKSKFHGGSNSTNQNISIIYIPHLDRRNSTIHHDGRNSTIHHGGRNSTIHHGGRNSTIHHGGRNSTSQHGWKSKFHGGSNSTNQNISIILRIEISNPNKRIGIHHDDIKVALYHNGSFIGNSSVAGFHQGYRETAFCEVKVNANQNFRTGIMGKRVDFLVNLRTRVQYVYDIFRYRTKRQQMDIDAYMSMVPSLIGNEN